MGTAHAASATTVGFVGLGSQGGAMATMIGRAGFPLTVWARRAEVCEPYAAEGAIVAADLVALARADMVGVCVVDDDDVREVVAAMRPGLRRGAVVALHSTILPTTAHDVAADLARIGVDVLDAPVMGGGHGALSRALRVAVGCDLAVLERCRPVLESYGNPIVHVGEVGAGQVMKLMFNLLFTANVAMHALAAELCAELGLDREHAADVLDHLTHSVVASRVAHHGITPGTMEHAARMLTKDVDHALAVVRAAGLDAAVLGAAGRDGLAMLAHGVSVHGASGADDPRRG
jgi:3-hydroxyisobutyrate dehydrogenase-like beta-hydroxyacid dehydrogenase